MSNLSSPELKTLFDGSVVPVDKQIWAAKITPEMAAQLLQNSVDVKNREIAKGHVAYLRYLMMSGQWKFPAPALVVDEKGRVYNGQHRLTAQIQAKMTIQYVFMLGDEVTMLAFDNNKARTLNDRLRMKGYTDSNTMAASARIAAWIQLTGGVPKRMEDRPELKSPQFMLEYIDRYNKQLARSVKTAIQTGYHAHGVVTNSVAAGIHFSIARREDPAVADKMLIDLHESDKTFWLAVRKSIKVATRTKMRNRLRREDATRILLRAYDRMINKSTNIDIIDPDKDYPPVLKGAFRA